LLPAVHMAITATAAKIVNQYYLKKQRIEMDFYAVLLGSLLPDLIDKPLELLVQNYRTFGHSLILLLTILFFGAVLYQRSRKIWLLTISFGVLMHLTLDQMWLLPRTLFWPLLGHFEYYHNISLWRLIQGVLSKPEFLIFEITAVFLLIILFRGWK